MLLHFIGVLVPLLPFGEILVGLIILLERSHALSVQLIGLAFDDDQNFVHLWIVETVHVL